MKELFRIDCTGISRINIMFVEIKLVKVLITPQLFSIITISQKSFSLPTLIFYCWTYFAQTSIWCLVQSKLLIHVSIIRFFNIHELKNCDHFVSSRLKFSLFTYPLLTIHAYWIFLVTCSNSFIRYFSKHTSIRFALLSFVWKLFDENSHRQKTLWLLQ